MTDAGEMLGAGDELDRRVGEIMGWADKKCQWSQAPAFVGIMLEWAAAQGGEPYVWFNAAEWEARVYADGNRHYGCGSTPQLALALALAASTEPR